MAADGVVLTEESSYFASQTQADFTIEYSSAAIDTNPYQILGWYVGAIKKFTVDSANAQLSINGETVEFTIDPGSIKFTQK